MIRLTQSDQIEPYLKDASQFHGEAEGVFVPDTEKEVIDFLTEANAKKIPVTIAGGRTGLAGAAVPRGGWVLSTEKLNRILEIRKDPVSGRAWARLGPGIYLKDLDHETAPQGLFYPPDPTGPWAFLGGTLATNASGPNSFKYGATRRYVRRIRMALASGEVIELKRGQVFADSKGILEIPLARVGAQHAVPLLKIRLPHYSIPKVKHAGGYYAAPEMDALDLLIGSEGTLGVFLEIEAALLPRPSGVFSFVVFFRREEDSWRFAKAVRGITLRNAPSPLSLSPPRGEGRVRGEGLEARILEYFDGGSLDFLRPQFAAIPKEARACIFVEQEMPDGGARHAVPLQNEWHRLFEKNHALPEIWEGDTPEKQEEFRRFRSELPLAVRDFLVKHGQRKVGTDTSVPHESFEKLMRFHRGRVETLGLASVTFGHIGESHVHLNLLPRNDAEAEKGRALYPELVKEAVRLGGSFSAEHGVGKLKRPYLIDFFGEKAVQEMAAVKRVFDPENILGRGNIFGIE